MQKMSYWGNTCVVAIDRELLFKGELYISLNPRPHADALESICSKRLSDINGFYHICKYEYVYVYKNYGIELYMTINPQLYADAYWSICSR